MSKTYTAEKIKAMIAGAEKNGGSTDEIISAVKQWDEAANTVEITCDGEIIIDGKALTDDETEQWFFWTQGGFKNRQGN